LFPPLLFFSPPDAHGEAKVAYPWQAPTDPAKWKEEHVVFAVLGGWVVTIWSATKIFGGGGKKEEPLVKATDAAIKAADKAVHQATAAAVAAAAQVAPAVEKAAAAVEKAAAAAPAAVATATTTVTSAAVSEPVLVVPAAPAADKK
jgi:hypothetical protein